MQGSGVRPDGVGALAWLRQAIDASGDILYEWDLASDAIAWAGRIDELFAAGAPRTGDAFKARINPQDLPVRIQALSEPIRKGTGFDCEYRIRTEDGEFGWVQDRGAAILALDGTPQRVVGSLRPITARKQHEAQLERLASFDDLTGHFNKVRLRDSLEHALAYNRRYGLPGAYLVVGADNLAVINSAYGHRTGDAVLVEIGQRLDRLLRESDVVGRIGADRFGIVLSQCTPAQMGRAAERILLAVRDNPIETPESRVHATVSIGGIAFSGQESSAYDVMAKAESALSQAKKEGRDCFAAHRISEDFDRLQRRCLDLGARVQRALREDRLCFAFQPVVRAHSHHPVFHECLLRMREESGEIVPAAAFIPVVEPLGLMRLIDRHVLELAVRELGADRGHHLAINISGLTATDQSWLRALRALLKGKPDVASRLIVEITETAALHDIDESARFVTALRELGCRVAVDDFGAGFTSFKHLRALKVDIVKIDGSFVRNLSGNVDNQLFIRNLLGLADVFGLETVAECVETLEDANFLVGEGVQYLQGYYFGRPSLERPSLELKPVAGAAAAAAV